MITSFITNNVIMEVKVFTNDKDFITYKSDDGDDIIMNIRRFVLNKFKNLRLCNIALHTSRYFGLNSSCEDTDKISDVISKDPNFYGFHLRIRIGGPVVDDSQKLTFVINIDGFSGMKIVCRGSPAARIWELIDKILVKMGTKKFHKYLASQIQLKYNDTILNHNYNLAKYKELSVAYISTDRSTLCRDKKGAMAYMLHHLPFYNGFLLGKRTDKNPIIMVSLAPIEAKYSREDCDHCAKKDYGTFITPCCRATLCYDCTDNVEDKCICCSLNFDTY